MEEKITVMITAEEIDKRVTELARKIENDYKGQTLTLVCVLKGAVMFMVDLSRKLNMPVEFDFMDISSYGDESESSGIIKVNKDLEHPIGGKNVILVEDIIDSGRTLSYLLKHLEGKEPKSVKICSLLDKPDRRLVNDFEGDYVGFKIPDEFVVGYGLDFAQRHRNLPYIGILETTN